MCLMKQWDCWERPDRSRHGDGWYRHGMSYGLKSVGFCMLLLAMVGDACADTITVSNQVACPGIPIDARDMDPDFSPKLGTYYYRFHWLLKTGAKTTVSIAKQGSEYHMTTTAATGRFVDLIYRVRYRAKAVLDAASLKAVMVEVKETVRSTKKHTVIEYEDGKLRATRTRKKKKRPKPSVHESDVDTKEGRVMDYFSAILLTRAVEWKKGARRSIEVFDGRGLNNVCLSCVGTKKIKVQGKRIKTWHIKVKVTQIGAVDEDDELIAEDINLYLSADESREIIQIDADTPFGGLKVKLDSFVPAAQR